MSMWQFFAAVDGYIKAHGADEQGLSGGEQDELWKLVESKTERLRDGRRH